MWDVVLRVTCKVQTPRKLCHVADQIWIGDLLGQEIEAADMWEKVFHSTTLVYIHLHTNSHTNCTLITHFSRKFYCNFPFAGKLLTRKIPVQEMFDLESNLAGQAKPILGQNQKKLHLEKIMAI
eukprot:Phypoly_transcript_15067.p1 GENE.Phypoly_transcript_15067~~Phypoly_transcript_15067.p1  ORF type:complete len:124 (+),score=20.18 Phypoly_transcript_15067:305-676(+)